MESSKKEKENGNGKDGECHELKTIKYKSMMMTGIVKEPIITNNINHLDAFLEKEKTNVKGEPWSKLDKMTKINKLTLFADAYGEDQQLSQHEIDTMLAFLKDSLDRKRLSQVKNVNYDKTTGLIKDIPALHFNKSANHFTLKNMDKQRTSTLKSLPPKKIKTKDSKAPITIDDVSAVAEV